MPIPDIQMEDSVAGTPRQAVPLRYACLVADWSPGTLLSLLAGVDDIHMPSLSGYVATDRGPEEYHPSEYARLRARLVQVPGAVVGMRDLPCDHFVWSDDFAAAFTRVIDASSDREYEAGLGTGLRWRPALMEHEAAIAECTDISNYKSVRKDGHALRTERAELQYQRWREMQQVIEKEHPSWSKSRIAQQIRDDLPLRDKCSVDRIRKKLMP